MSIKSVIQSEMKVHNVDVLVLKKNIKNFHLNVLPPNGRVRVSVPHSTSDNAVQMFVLSRMYWIKRQIKIFKCQSRQVERKYISGESHYFKGVRYLLDVQNYEGKSYIEVRNKKYIDLYIDETASTNKKNKIFTQWYREELQKEIPDLLQKWERIIGVNANSVRIRKMKTRWGTCNTERKVICLNLDLIKKPIHCLEYIIAHELVHLIEEKHNDLFVKHMDKFMPNWEKYKKELNECIL